MPKFRKKPVVINAVQWDGNNGVEVATFLEGASFSFSDAGDKVFIETLEGEMTATILDWIIKGVKGEFYPCKPDIFEATYDRVEAAAGKWDLK